MVLLSKDFLNFFEFFSDVRTWRGEKSPFIRSKNKNDFEKFKMGRKLAWFSRFNNKISLDML